MRVITGKYKGRHFDVPHSFKSHPTTDFAKENLFNVLRAYIALDDITCLDLFSGTGSIALEMLSRGAQHVTIVEKDHDHISFIRACLDKIHDTNNTTICGDAFKFLATCQQQYHLIFADPPYAMPTIPTIPDIIFSRNLLADDGILVVEHSNKQDFSPHPRFLTARTYGKVHFSLFR